MPCRHAGRSPWRAAHRGLGANAGIQDAHNLAWKLAMVVRGEDWALLGTYEQQRRPVGETTMGQAMARFGARMGPGEAAPVLPYSAVAAGYRTGRRPCP